MREDERTRLLEPRYNLTPMLATVDVDDSHQDHCIQIQLFENCKKVLTLGEC